MKKPAYQAMAGALLLIVGAAEGPRLLPIVRAWLATRSWHATQLAFGEAFARMGSSLNWSRPAMIGAAVVLGFCIVGGLWLFRREPRIVASEPVVGADRRGQVVRLARMGNGVAEIARETRLAQDAVRAMLAAR